MSGRPRNPADLLHEPAGQPFDLGAEDGEAGDEAGNASTRIVATLRKRILSGHLPGGSRLHEVALAQELAVSRTPVREAMSRLAEEGLLERKPNCGFMVRAFSAQDVVDAIELRGVIEGTAARLVAERGARPNELTAIEATLRGLDGCFREGDDQYVDLDAYSELNTRYHDQLVDLARSDTLRRQYDRIVRLPFAAPSAFIPDRPGRPIFRRPVKVGHAHHHYILEAIRTRQGLRAEFYAREHAGEARFNIQHILASRTEGPRRLDAFELLAP